VPPLSPDRWLALSPYLDEALEIPGDRRAAWLAAISARDRALGADLETLLSEHEDLQESRFLEQPLPLFAPAQAPSLEGQVFGAYRLISLIGQGGMGSVWLAERCDGRFEVRAAVKLLNVALVGHAGEERFRREGKFLAKVTHPHIARLIDAGVSAAGQPYLVLEHVNGQPIDSYCNDRALAIEERIRLFLDVLEAVAHAHANLIVHRDIKPANILVSPDFKHTKLVDLGVIRPVDGIEADATDHGLQRPFVATAQYSSPEYLFRLIEPSAELWRALTIYQIGGVLHDLIMRKPLFNDAVLTNNRYVLAMAVYQQTPAVVAPDVEPYLINLARKCLQKDHQKRLSLVGWGSFIATRTSFDPNAARAELGLKRSASVQRSIGASASDDRENELMLRGLVDDVRNVMSGVVDEEGYPSPHWISHGNSLTIVMPCRCATGECADVSLLIRLSMRSATEPIEVTVSSWLGEAKSLNLDDGAASFLLEPNEDQGHLKRFLSDELLARFYRATLMLGAGSRIGIVLAAGE